MKLLIILAVIVGFGLGVFGEKLTKKNFIRISLDDELSQAEIYSLGSYLLNFDGSLDHLQITKEDGLMAFYWNGDFVGGHGAWKLNGSDGYLPIPSTKGN